MKNSIFGKNTAILRYLCSVVVFPILAFIFFSSAAAISANSASLSNDVATISSQDSGKLIGLAGLVLEENEKEETEEKNHSEDQKKLENAKVFVPTIVLHFIPRFDVSTQAIALETDQINFSKVPLYVAFHSWKTFC